MKHTLLEGEIYDPETGVWTTTAPISEGRNYHTTAVLLRDGRVLVGGGHPGGDPPSPRLLSFEIFSPDYLFRGPRPVFSTDKNEVSRGSDILIRLGAGWRYKHIDPKSICLIRCYSVTHAFATDQRCVFLDPFVRTTSRRLIKKTFDVFVEGTPLVEPQPTEDRFEPIDSTTYPFPSSELEEFFIRIPSASGIIPCGYYMLFVSSLIDGDHTGTPSIGKMIKVL